MQIKIFEHHRVDKVEQYANEWLEKNSHLEVVDIKLSSYGGEITGEGFECEYQVMIIHK